MLALVVATLALVRRLPRSDVTVGWTFGGGTTTPPMDSESGRRPPFRAALRRAVRLRDVALLLLVPGVLVGVFALPLDVRRSLAFRYTDPTLATAYTAHFVHLESSHLLANVLAFLLLAGVGYLLATLAGPPPAVRHGDRHLPARGAVRAVGTQPRGAAERRRLRVLGVNLAFAGLLPLLLVAYARRRLDARVRLRHAPGLFFAALAVVAVVALPWSPVSVGVAGVAAVAAVAYAVPLVRSDAPRASTGASTAGWLDLLVVGLVLYLARRSSRFQRRLASRGRVEPVRPPARVLSRVRRAVRRSGTRSVRSDAGARGGRRGLTPSKDLCLADTFTRPTLDGFAAHPHARRRGAPRRDGARTRRRTGAGLPGVARLRRDREHVADDGAGRRLRRRPHRCRRRHRGGRRRGVPRQGAPRRRPDHPPGRGETERGFVTRGTRTRSPTRTATSHR